MPHKCQDCGLACSCTPGDAVIYSCTHYLECAAADLEDDFDLSDTDYCPECGVCLESEYHDWDCSYSSEDEYDDDEDLDEDEEWDC